VDVINLACNENDTKKDFSLAFVGMLKLGHAALFSGDVQP